jgi:hypothetical protein
VRVQGAEYPDGLNGASKISAGLPTFEDLSVSERVPILKNDQIEVPTLSANLPILEDSNVSEQTPIFPEDFPKAITLLASWPIPEGAILFGQVKRSDQVFSPKSHSTPTIV